MPMWHRERIWLLTQVLIEITNKLNEYKLPETGGSGNRWLYMLSGVGALLAIATITLFYKKQKKL